jgi:hypothetical protein
MRKIIIIYLLFISLFSCKEDEQTNALSSNVVLTNPTWIIQKATGKGGGYNFSFDKNTGNDPFQFTKVRIKLEPSGAITGIDNNGSSLSGATWKYYETDKKLEISGSNIFGIDGTHQVITIESSLVELRNELKVPQLNNAIVEVNASLIPLK